MIFQSKIFGIVNFYLKVRELSEEEKKQIMMSEDYQLSVSRAARIMQRMLALNDAGLTVDYSGADNEGKDE